MSERPTTFDVFLDLSQQGRETDRVPAQIAALRTAPGAAGRITVCAATPIESPDAMVFADRVPIAVLARAVRMAARSRRHLLVILGPVPVDAALVDRLAGTFDQDPMFGTAQPRFADAAGERIWPLPAGDERPVDTATIGRATLAPAPADAITPELVSCCLLLRWEVLVATEAETTADDATLVGALRHRLAAARRIGFRNLVCNRAVVAVPLAYADIYPVPSAAEIDALRRIDPDAAGAAGDLANLPQRRQERLLEAACADHRGRRRLLLLDCRSMSLLHNGTTVCMLGVLDGFAGLDAGWDVHLQATKAAAEFHDLVRRYPQFVHLDHLHDPAEDRFAAAVMLSQPWETGQIRDLHRRALVLSFLMLDAIAWDIYPGRPQLTPTWQLAARHADILFYISAFTGERFRRRFPVAPGVTEAVALLSLSAADYVAAPPSHRTRSADHILIFGNEFQHKHVRPTAQLLADAFPFHRITALGLENVPGHNVTSIGSGRIPREMLLALIDSAGVIVFPSFYEGFGLPVVEGLARGVTVVVRRSTLWEEIAGHTRLPGRLCVFDDPASLVDAVGRTLSGRPLAEMPQGAALADGAAPGGWSETARRISDVVAGRLAGLDPDHWRERDRALRLIEP